jgi:hypothetical protein
MTREELLVLEILMLRVSVRMMRVALRNGRVPS